MSTYVHIYLFACVCGIVTHIRCAHYNPVIVNVIHSAFVVAGGGGSAVIVVFVFVVD